MLFHERWHAELVIGETRTVMRLSARTLRSLTPQGVIQELYALLLAHTLLRTLMLRAAAQQGSAPTTLSLTGTIRIIDESLLPLGMVPVARRRTMVLDLLTEIGQQRLPKNPGKGLRPLHSCFVYYLRWRKRKGFVGPAYTFLRCAAPNPGKGHCPLHSCFPQSLCRFI